ncbi:MAG: cytidine deaminase [Bacteroidetes bacterium]|jgi:cytidine deaminase|nr:cytidine deaminase [Bacteroidota bacterium]
MQVREYTFSFEVFNSIEELTILDSLLLNKAKEATIHAYAPYSKFRVAAAARLGNGEIILGTNQENASYPAGICAERVLLSTSSSIFPSVPIETIAITYKNENGLSNHPISPCGICRQTLQEYEQRQKTSIRLLLGGLEGNIYVISNASLLMPLAFTSNELK